MLNRQLVSRQRIFRYKQKTFVKLRRDTLSAQTRKNTDYGKSSLWASYHSGGWFSHLPQKRPQPETNPISFFCTVAWRSILGRGSSQTHSIPADFVQVIKGRYEKQIRDERASDDGESSKSLHYTQSGLYHDHHHIPLAKKRTHNLAHGIL